MWLKILIWCVLIYLIYRMVNNFFYPPQKQDNIRGHQKSKPIDYKESDIVDVPYREIKDDEKSK